MARSYEDVKFEYEYAVAALNDESTNGDHNEVKKLKQQMLNWRDDLIEGLKIKQTGHASNIDPRERKTKKRKTNRYKCNERQILNLDATIVYCRSEH